MPKSTLSHPKCIGCGRILEHSKSESHMAGRRYVGYCYNREKHNGMVLKFVIVQHAVSTPKISHQTDIIDIENDLVTFSISSIVI